MYITSELHKTIYADPAHVVQSKATIAGTDYTDGAGLWDLSITGGLFAEDHPAIGGAVAREIDLELKNPGEIPRMAKIEVFARVALVDAVTGETTTAAEWIPRGVFFIATRSFDASGEFLAIHGYDAMLKGERAFLDQASGETGEWPQGMDAVASACAAKMGVEIDPRTVINPDFTIDYPNDYTIRELLQHIAVANAGNWTISCEGKLRLCPLVDPAADVIDIGTDAMDLSSAPELAPISMVRVWGDDEHCYEAGDGSGRLLEVDCPWATQDVTEAILEAVSALVYVPIEVTDAFLDPAVELGDLLTVTDITSPIGSMTETFGVDYSATISAPADDEVDNEYPYTSSTVKEFDRKLAKTKAAIKVTTDEIQSTVEDMEGNVSKISQTVDGISMSVSGTLTDGTNSYVEISLQVGDKVTKGYVVIDGNVNVSGQLSAEALYAALGDIAKLTVDSVSTSRRIPKYLAGDPSDDNYIDISEQHIRLMRGQTDGTTEQAKNPNGSLLYWEKDLAGASIGADGYPYLDGVRVFTTTEQTAWPVMVYVYEDAVRREISFNTDKMRTPIDVFGHGYGMDDPDRGKGFIQKSELTFDMWLLNSKGERRGIFIGDDYTDIAGMRKSSGLDFSKWDEGRFYERVDGDDTNYEYSVEFDANKRPVKITDPTGHTMEITW